MNNFRLTTTNHMQLKTLAEKVRQTKISIALKGIFSRSSLWTRYRT